MADKDSLGATQTHCQGPGDARRSGTKKASSIKTQGARRDPKYGGGKKGHLARLPADAMTFCSLWGSHQGPPLMFTASRVMSQSDELKKGQGKPKLRPGAHPGCQSLGRKAPGRASSTPS